MRMVDADALTKGEWWVEYSPYNGCDVAKTDKIVEQIIKQCKDIVNNAPTVDAVPVVRCKGCRYYDADCDWCYHIGRTIESHKADLFFCADGERRTE